MKNLVFIFLLVITCGNAMAQNVIYKNNAAYIAGKPVVMLVKGHKHMDSYVLQSGDHTDLAAVHYSRVEIKGRPGYMVKFLNDGRHGMFVAKGPFVNSFLTEIMAQKLISGNEIDAAAETKFIAAHPVPTGYTDVEELNEYGVCFPAQQVL